MLALASTAQAGHYELKKNPNATPPYEGYAGGKSTGPAPPPQTGSVEHLYGYDGSKWGGAISATKGTVNCAGTITATFVWVGVTGEPTPKYAVVKETCKTVASWDNGGNGSVTNPLGFPVVSTANSKTSSGTKYTLKENPGSEFAVTCEPLASATAPASGGLDRVESSSSSRSGTTTGGGGDTDIIGQDPKCSASVEYSAEAAPVYIDLTGGKPSTNYWNKQYLIGQKVTATLIAGGLTPTYYHWSTDTPDSFFSWTATQTQANFVGATGTLSATYYQYFKKPHSDASIKCGTHLQVPVNAKPEAGFDIDLVTSDNSCVVLPPDSITLLPTIGTVDLGYRVNGSEVAGPYIMLTHAVRGNTPIGTGCDWQTAVTTPPDFGGVGVFNWVQTGKQIRSITTNDEQIHYDSLNNLTGLDSVYPYGPDPAGDFPTSGPGSSGPGSYDANGQTKYDGDTPGNPIAPSLLNSSAQDEFTTYLMFLPPGTGSCYVPLKSFKWRWNGTAYRDLMGWHISESGQSKDSVIDYPDFPTWVRAVGTGKGTWQPLLP